MSEAELWRVKAVDAVEATSAKGSQSGRCLIVFQNAAENTAAGFCLCRKKRTKEKVSLCIYTTHPLIHGPRLPATVGVRGQCHLPYFALLHLASVYYKTLYKRKSAEGKSCNLNEV